MSSDASKVAEAKKISMGLQSQDKKVRKQALVELQTLLSSDDWSNQELRDCFTETHMYTLSGFRDKAEAVREQAIKFLMFLIIEKLPLNDFYLTYVFPVIVERIGTVELVEESEEIRLQLLEFFRSIVIKYSNTEQLKPFLGDCVEILKETVKDKHPAIKELSCKCVQELAEALPKDFHMQAESLVKPIITCFGHQRYRVRVEAVKAIGEVIMHSSYNGLDEAIVPLAGRLFDQIPLVRRTVSQVTAKWLLDYRDRYSFFHKILPLLLTGLNDEFEETRAEAHGLWETVGLQYQQENEKDFKDMLDFQVAPPKYYPNHLTRPNLGCRQLVQRNVGKLTKALAFELSSWQDDIRVRCAQLLCAIALNAEDGLTQNLQDLLPAMYSAARDPDPRVTDNIVRSSELIGLFVRADVWCKLVLPAIEDGAHFGHLSVLCGLIKGCPEEYISASLEEIARLLSDNSICFTRKKEFQTELLKCVQAISDKLPEDPNEEIGFHLFKITAAIFSLRHADNTEITPVLFDDLSAALKMPSVAALWSCNTGRLLNEIGNDPKSWTSLTPQLCIFETVLLHAGAAFGENLEVIGSILAVILHVDVDVEIRLKTYHALSKAFEDKAVIFSNAQGLAPFFYSLIKGVFVGQLVWRAGSTAEAVRTMALSCLLCALSPSPGVELFDNNEDLMVLHKELVPLLLSLMEDASYLSRQLAMQCLAVLKEIDYEKGIWNVDDLIKIYPEVLKRLDDPTEQVRVCGLRVLVKLFEGVPDDFKERHYNAHHELIIDTLLTHFDDDDEKIAALVFDVLKVVVSVNAKEVESKVLRHKPLLRNQKGCVDILDYLAKKRNPKNVL